VALDVDSMLKSQVSTFKSMADVMDMHKSSTEGLALMARKDTHETIKEGFMAQATSGIMSRFLDGKVIKRIHKSTLDERVESPTEADSLKRPVDTSSDSDSDDSDSSESDYERQNKKRKTEKGDKKKVGDLCEIPKVVRRLYFLHL
jgi:hypothetical protein